jgi:hypothetical protein
LRKTVFFLVFDVVHGVGWGWGWGVLVDVVVVGVVACWRCWLGVATIADSSCHV